MLASAVRAFRELFTPEFRAVLLRSLGLTIALLVLVMVVLQALFATLVVLPGWMETAIQIVGGLGLLIGSVFLVAPITSLIAGLYLDRIASEVERRSYPSDPPGTELPTLDSIWIALKFTIVVVLVNILVLVMLLLPGVNVIAFFVANGYLLGREYFELAALRHLPAKQVKALRKAHKGRIFLSGLVIAGVLAVPVLNLLTPLFATAFMVHTFKDLMAKRAKRAARAGAAF